MTVLSWTAPVDRLKRNDNQAAQEPVDNDNFRSAIARVCSNDTIADIGAHNIQMVCGLYHQSVESLGHPTPPPTAQQHHHLPGDICASIKAGAKNRGSSANDNSIVAFVDLVSFNITKVNSDIRQNFNLVYNNTVPMETQCYFRDRYLLFLYKDPEDMTKLRPIGIPSAMRQIIASHVSAYTRQRFARRIRP